MKPMRQTQGFTLIELMVVIAIIGIIAAVAYPSYNTHVQRTRRVTAAGCLSEIAQAFERQYTINMAYSASLPSVGCLNENSAYYNFSLETVAASSTTFAVTAAPTGVQASDVGCGALRLDNMGIKGVSGANPVAQCWR